MKPLTYINEDDQHVHKIVLPQHMTKGKQTFLRQATMSYYFPDEVQQDKYFITGGNKNVIT